MIVLRRLRYLSAEVCSSVNFLIIFFNQTIPQMMKILMFTWGKFLKLIKINPKLKFREVGLSKEGEQNHLI